MTKAKFEAVVRFTEYTEDDDELEHELPAKFEVCHRCRGRGTHVNPSIDGHGITAEEWDRDWSYEDRENYMSGFYDVDCHECDGLRVVAVVDEKRCDPELLEKYRQFLEDEAMFARERASELKYGY